MFSKNLVEHLGCRVAFGVSFRSCIRSSERFLGPSSTTKSSVAFGETRSFLLPIHSRQFSLPLIEPLPVEKKKYDREVDFAERVSAMPATTKYVATPEQLAQITGPIEFTRTPVKLTSYDNSFTRAVPKNGGALRIMSYNVNGLRSRLSDKMKDCFLKYMKAEDPDIICLQETKLQQSHESDFRMCFGKAYPHSVFFSSTAKKGYSGVAIFSKMPPLKTTKGMNEPNADSEGRVVTCHYEKFILVNSYTKNSGMGLESLPNRVEVFDASFLKYIKGLVVANPDKSVIVTGDLNVAYYDMDVYNPKGFRNKSAGFCDGERLGFKNMLDAGFHDVFREKNPTLQQFTFFSQRSNARIANNGWRLDYFLTTGEAANLEKVNVVSRSDVQLSDHTPVLFDWEGMGAAVEVPQVDSGVSKKRQREEEAIIVLEPALPTL